MKLRANSLRRIKMAPRTRIVKIGALFLSQFGLLAALNFQLFGMVTAYKMMELKRNLSLAAYLSARKTYLQRKRRNLQARRVRRKRRSVWVINGRTDQWWQNMIGEDVPDWCWRKNSRMSKECFISFFPLKSLLLCSGSHLVSWKTKSLRMSKPGWNSVSITWDFFRFSSPFGRAENPRIFSPGWIAPRVDSLSM